MSDFADIDSTSGLEVRVFDRLEVPDISAEAWNELAARSDTHTVFQTHEWTTSWWQVFSTGRGLLLIAVFRNETLVGLAPMMSEPGDSGTSTLRFIGDGNADYCDFLLAEPRLPVLRRLVAALAGLRDRWRLLCLNNIPQHSFTAQHFRPLCAATGLLPLVSGRVDCPSLVFDGLRSPEESLLHKHSLRRPYNYFRARGRVEFTELTESAAALHRLPDFFAQHRERWRDTGSPSLFENPQNREFYRILLERLLPTGWLVFSVVTFDGRPLAFHFGFDYGQRYYWYKPSFDPAFRKHSPGNLLLRYLLVSAVNRRCREFDFTIGNEEFKRRYSNTTRHNINLQIFSHRPAYVLSRLWLATRQHVRQILFRRM